MLIRGLDGFEHCQGGIVSIGNFDGVHLGHQLMIQTLIARARSQKLPAVVFTFDPHPIHLLRPEHAPPELMGIEERATILQEIGVDYVVAYPTNHDLLNLSAEDFFLQILCDQLQAKGLVEGPNFYFGKNRKGDVHLLKSLCDRAGMSFQVIEPGLCDGRMISSSEIRQAIQGGDVTLAAEMLGRFHQITGTVEHGVQRGRVLGFPTANLSKVQSLLPAAGVYSGFGIVGEQRFPAAIHLGNNPTFQNMNNNVEVHLIGFSGDIYGESLQVEFLNKLRETQTFSGADALKAQLAIDIDSAKKQVDEWNAGS